MVVSVSTREEELHLLVVADQFEGFGVVVALRHEQHGASRDCFRARDPQLLADPFGHAPAGEPAAYRGDGDQVTDVGVLGGDAVEDLLTRLEQHLEDVVDVR